MRLAVAACVLALPSLAQARPITAGAIGGFAKSKADASDDSTRTLGLFGRVGVTPRLAGQLEIQQYHAEVDSDTRIRTWGLLLVIDLGAHPHWVPTMIAGVGVDHVWSSNGIDVAHGHHYEGGFGLEYRATGGFVIGADARIGSRSMESDILFEDPGPVFRVPNHLSDGEYRSVRLTLGVRF